MADLRGIFTQIYEERGRLVPDEVHDIVADEEHPLHDRYEWDDSVAGRKYRVQQIRQDIRSCRVEYESPDSDEPQHVRAFSSVRQDPGRVGYAPTEEVLQNDFSRTLLLRQLKRDLAVLKSKYAHLEEFTGVLIAAAETG